MHDVAPPALPNGGLTNRFSVTKQNGFEAFHVDLHARAASALWFAETRLESFDDRLSPNMNTGLGNSIVTLLSYDIVVLNCRHY